MSDLEWFARLCADLEAALKVTYRPAMVVLQDDGLKVIRSDYAGFDKASKSEIVGVYDFEYDKNDLLDDIEVSFSERAERQERQSRILAEQVGLPG